MPSKRKPIMKRTTSPANRRKAIAQLPDEKAVRRTIKTVPLAPPKPSRRAKKPMPTAIDRRTHFPEAD
ncbi:MAG TPA: hypothetical protein VFW23_08560 [Tepidisphaeraceae bacterium]|nr:hypothetical protein [Tepidisphaeraceae bacterium]